MSQSSPKPRRKSHIPDYVPSRRSHAGQPSVTPEMLIQRTFDFLKRRGLLAGVLATIVGAAVGYAAYRNMPLEYTAERTVTLTLPNDGSTEFGRFKESQIHDLTSYAVAKSAVAMKEVQDIPGIQTSKDPATDISTAVEIETTSQDQNIQVKISDPDAKVAQTLVNALVDAYLENAKVQKSQSLKHALEAAQRERQDAIDAQMRIEESKNALAQKVGFNDPETLQKNAEEIRREYTAKTNERDRVIIELLKSNKDLEFLKSTEPTLTAEQAERIEQAAGQNDQSLVRALSQMQAQADEIKRQSNLGERDPTYIRYQAFIEDQRSKMNASIKEKRERIMEDNKTRRLADIQKTTNQVQALEAQEKNLDRRILELGRQVSEFDSIVTEMRKFGPDLVTVQRRVENADARIVDLNQAAQETYVSSPQRADVPLTPKSSKQRTIAIFGGASAAFFLIMSLFGWADFNVNLVGRPDHLERTQPLPVIGVLPKLPEGKRLPSDSDFEQGKRTRGVWIAMNEAINSLRITLTFAPDRHNDGMSALMVTSPRDAEGKSTLCAHLATSLARSGVKTLLIEADFHRPTQFETFGVPVAPGLSDVLRGAAKLEEVVKETDYPNMFIVTAGNPIEGDLTSILRPNAIKELFDTARTMFQTLIVDAPPVLPVYDAMVFGQQVDDTVLVVRSDHSRVQTIDQARGRLESVGVRVMGLVVTGNPSASRYGYYYESYAGRNGYSTNGHSSHYTNGKNGTHSAGNKSQEPSSSSTA